MRADDFLLLTDKSKFCLKDNIKRAWRNASLSVRVHSLGVMPPSSLLYPIIRIPDVEVKGLVQASRAYIELYGDDNEDYLNYFLAHLLIHNVNMTEEARAWQILSYPAKAVKGLIAENTARIIGILFQNGNYAVKFQNELLQRLLNNATFLGTDFVTFLEQHLVPLMRDDANGFIGVDINELDIPTAIYLPSDCLTHTDGEMYRFYHCGIEYLYDGGVIVKTYADDTTIEKRHKVGVAPIVQLGGVNRNGHYESFWAAGVSNLDTFVRLYLDFAVLSNKHTHPITQSIELPCQTCEETGWVRIDENNKPCEPKLCYACGGDKYVQIDHSRAINIPFDLARRADGAIDKMEFIKHYRPDTSAKESAAKAMNDFYNTCKEDLNLLFVDAAQSGTAKAIDREERNAIISQISNRVFFVAKKVLTNLVQVYTGSTEEAIVVPSRVLNIIKGDDLIGNYIRLKREGADALMIERAREAWIAYATKDEKSTAKITRILELVAPLRDYSSAELLSLYNSEVAKRDDVLFSIFSFAAIKSFIEINGMEVFMDTENSKIIEYIELYVANKTPTDALTEFDADGEIE